MPPILAPRKSMLTLTRSSGPGRKFFTRIRFGSFALSTAWLTSASPVSISTFSRT